MTYFADRTSVAQLGRFPQPREAKGQAGLVRRFRIVPPTRATYDDVACPPRAAPH